MIHRGYVWPVGALIVFSLFVTAAAGQGQPLPIHAPAAVSPTLNPSEPVDILVDLNIAGRPLQELLHTLDVAPFPRLVANPAVGGERLSVYVRRRSRASLQRDLQILLNYDWIPDTDRPPVQRYTLVPSERLRQYEADLRQKTLERGATRLYELTRYLSTSQEDYEALAAQLQQQNREPADPMLRDNLFYLSRYGPRLGLRLLTTLAPEQRLTLLDEGQLMLLPGEMTPEQQALTHDLGLSIGEFRKRIQHAQANEKPEDIAALADQIGIVLRVPQHPITGTAQSLDYGLGEGGMVCASLENQAPLPDLLPVRGNPYHFDPNRADATRKPPLPRYPLLEKMAFPADFQLAADGLAAWRDIVAELARHLSLPIYSDEYAFSPAPDPANRLSYFPEASQPVGAPALVRELKRVTLEAGLDALCNRYHYLWWYEGGALFFRSRTWFIERQYEMPPEVLALLESHLRKSGGRYDSACLTALSTLTLHQLQGLNVTSASHRPQLDRLTQFYQARYSYAYLQVISMLDEAQKEKVLSQSGLPLAEMNPQQQAAFIRMMFITRGPEILYRLPNIWLKADQPAVHPSTATPQFQTPVLYFSYKDGDAAIARVQVALQD
jgi:hypothetical protein